MKSERAGDIRSGRTAALSYAYDVFVDLSGTELDAKAAEAHMRLLRIQCGFLHSAGRLNVALPQGVAVPGGLAPNSLSSAPVAIWSRAVAHAAARRRYLVVILGQLLVGNETIPPLLEALHVDPLFGSAQPRFSDATTDGIWPLPSAVGLDAGTRQTSRAGLPLLPEALLTAEMLAACVVIRREVVSAMEPAEGFVSVPGALAHGLCQARRRGFRNVVANRVVVPCTLEPTKVYPTLPSGDATRHLELFPDAAYAAAENEHQPQRQLEPLLSAAYPRVGVQRRLLLDCRGLGTIYNGTSQCVLGMLDGFISLNASWQIDVLSGAAAAEFHRLAARYPGLGLLNEQISGYYAAIFMLDQPWALGRVAELHRHGFVIGFNILDTIGWDILYVAPERLTSAWRFIARHSDILTYISQFSQDQFRRRFPVSNGITEGVVHLSLLPHEHTVRQFHDIRLEDHVLLFGNDYDHKGVAPTIRLLTASFPLQPFVVLGGREPIAPGVRVIPSGTVSGEEVHRLIATARAIVYPSFYEGFGLPVIEGLAYGRPVLVRRSPLWTEIAAHSSFPGELFEFEDCASLVEKLGQVLAGLPPPAVPSGTALSEAPHAPKGWREAAATVLSLVEDHLARSDTRHWLERNEVLRMAQL